MDATVSREPPTEVPRDIILEDTEQQSLLNKVSREHRAYQTVSSSDSEIELDSTIAGVCSPFAWQV